MISIVPAIPEYLSDIYKMVLSLARLEGIEEKVKLTEDQLGQLLFCPAPIHFVGMALKDKCLVGLVMYNFTHHNIFCNVTPGIYIEQLFVEEAFRKQEIGKSLLAFVAEKAHKHGCSRIEWWVSNKNSEASNFYKRMGAISLSDWTIFKCDALGIGNLLSLNAA